MGVTNLRAIVVNPTANQNARQLARAFSEVGQLNRFVTSLKVPQALADMAPNGLKSELSRRCFADIDSHLVEGAVPWLEALRVLVERSKKLHGALNLGILPRISIEKISHAVDVHSANLLQRTNQIGLVYCYEDCAFETLQMARKRDIVGIYELPIGYWKAHHIENKRHLNRRPDWATSWIAIKDSTEKLACKDSELKLADKIIVASTFTSRTLEEHWSGDAICPICVVPYGFPEPIDARSRSWFTGEGPLRALYVGSLSERKGLSYLCEGVSTFVRKGRMSLTMVGRGEAEAQIRRTVPGVKIISSLSHSAILSLMAEHDVFIFPSLFEGFGLVLSEAMSRGMVVIGTCRTALPDIGSSDNSILVPPFSAEAIEGAVWRLLSSPLTVQSIGIAAIKAAAKYQWSDYRARVRLLNS